MIYNFLKGIVKVSLFFFYKKIDVFGKSKICDKGPIIIVSNHPSTMIDPLIVASITKQRIGFIANAGIFKNKLLIKVFTFLHIIPIYRKKDVSKGEAPDNTSTFVRCHEYLDAKGTFLIFPEGSSYYELKLREIKTGTARIALSYETMKMFKGNLRIIPISLDYTDSIQFRSSISVTVGTPINVSDFKDDYSKDNFKGVRALTNRIEKELAKNIPHTDDKTQEEFLIKLHKFYAAYFEPLESVLKNSGQTLLIRNRVSRVLSQVKETNETLYNTTRIKLFAFFEALEKENLSTGFFSNKFVQKNRLLVLLNYFIKFLILLPIYVFGLVINYIPYILPYKIFKLLNIDIEYKTSVQLVTGMIIFPLVYFIEIWLLDKYIGVELWLQFSLPVLFILSGYLAMYYWLELKRFFRIIYFYFFINENRKQGILKLRDEIMEEVENVRRGVLKE